MRPGRPLVSTIFLLYLNGDKCKIAENRTPTITEILLAVALVGFMKRYRNATNDTRVALISDREKHMNIHMYGDGR